jgi:hypothetical protein
MAIVPAKVVGEIVKGFITLELWPDRQVTESDDESSSTLADNITRELVPEDLRTPNAKIWLATEKTQSVPKGYVQKVFPRESDDYPQEYHDWLKGMEAK